MASELRVRSDLNAIDSDNSGKLFSAKELNTTAKPRKTKAEYQKEYRERQKAKKKQNSTAKPRKTKAEYQKEYRERQKAKKKQSTAKPPKTNAEDQKAFRERRKMKKNKNKRERCPYSVMERRLSGRIENYNYSMDTQDCNILLQDEVKQEDIGESTNIDQLKIEIGEEVFFDPSIQTQVNIGQESNLSYVESYVNDKVKTEYQLNFISPLNHEENTDESSHLPLSRLGKTIEVPVSFDGPSVNTITTEDEINVGIGSEDSKLKRLLEGRVVNEVPITFEDAFIKDILRQDKINKILEPKKGKILTKHAYNRVQNKRFPGASMTLVNQTNVCELNKLKHKSTVDKYNTNTVEASTNNINTLYYNYQSPDDEITELNRNKKAKVPINNMGIPDDVSVVIENNIGHKTVNVELETHSSGVFSYRINFNEDTSFTVNIEDTTLQAQQAKKNVNKTPIRFEDLFNLNDDNADKHLSRPSLTPSDADYVNNHVKNLNKQFYPSDADYVNNHVKNLNKQFYLSNLTDANNSAKTTQSELIKTVLVSRIVDKTINGYTKMAEDKPVQNDRENSNSGLIKSELFNNVLHEYNIEPTQIRNLNEEINLQERSNIRSNESIEDDTVFIIDEHNGNLENKNSNSSEQLDRTKFSCTKLFSNKNDCIKNFERYSINDKECPLCNTIVQEFNRNCHIKKHATDHFINHGRRVECKMCHQILNKKEAREHWERHLMSKYTEENDQLKYLKKFLTRRFINEKERCCVICDMKLDKTVSMRLHLVEHFVHCAEKEKAWTDGRMYCKFCKYVTTDVSRYSKHKMAHAVLKSFECDRCQDLFKDADSLMRHFNKNKCKIYACAHCYKKYTLAKTLESHIKTKHSTNYDIAVDAEEKRQQNEDVIEIDDDSNPSENQNIDSRKPILKGNPTSEVNTSKVDLLEINDDDSNSSENQNIDSRKPVLKGIPTSEVSTSKVDLLEINDDDSNSSEHQNINRLQTVFKGNPTSDASTVLIGNPISDLTVSEDVSEINSIDNKTDSNTEENNISDSYKAASATLDVSRIKQYIIEEIVLSDSENEDSEHIMNMHYEDDLIKIVEE